MRRSKENDGSRKSTVESVNCCYNDFIRGVYVQLTARCLLRNNNFINAFSSFRSLSSCVRGFALFDNELPEEGTSVVRQLVGV